MPDKSSFLAAGGTGGVRGTPPSPPASKLPAVSNSACQRWGLGAVWVSAPEDALEHLWLKNFSAEHGREPVEHLVAVVVVVAMQCEVRMYKGLLLALLTSFCPRVAFR